MYVQDTLQILKGEIVDSPAQGLQNAIRRPSDHNDTPWALHARCHQSKDSARDFRNEATPVQLLAAHCAACPVLWECLSDAITTRSSGTVSAGLTVRQRRALFIGEKNIKNRQALQEITSAARKRRQYHLSHGLNLTPQYVQILGHTQLRQLVISRVKQNLKTAPAQKDPAASTHKPWTNSADTPDTLRHERYMNILAALAEWDYTRGAPAIGDLSQSLEIPRTSLSHAIHEMSARGHVKIEPGENNRHLIHILRAGEECLAAQRQAPGLTTKKS